MAGPTISSLTLASAGLSADEFAIEVSGVSEKITLSQISVFSSSGTILKSLSADEAPTSAIAMVRVSGMDVAGVASGMYTFEYYVRAQFAAAGQSIKFAVNHTGTTTSFMYNFQYGCAASTASTGSITQAQNTTAGRVWSNQSTRVKNATLGPETNIDVINSDILFKISGMMIVTVSGDLQLFVGAESGTSGNITIMNGTSLVLKKVG